MMSLATLTSENVGREVSLQARVNLVRPVSNKLCFVILRDGISTLQVVVSKRSSSEEVLKRSKALSRESHVRVKGILMKPERPIVSVTLSELELDCHELEVLNVPVVLPIQVEDCSAKEGTLGYPGQDLRLNYRVIDLRTLTNQGIFRIQSGVGQLFREFLLTHSFIEIHTPKLINCASEGGASVFPVKYFNTEAYLAQSPQFYKQMAMCGDFAKVFEIGPVFRAENANTHRHLTEFTGLDLEMTFNQSYHEILDLIEQLFVYIFTGLETRFTRELSCIRDQFPFSPIKYLQPNGKILRLDFAEGIELLKQNGISMGELDDMDTPTERKLGEIIRNKYNVDFYIIDRFPSNIRPFYTQPSKEDPRYAHAFDIFLRGEEIVSGSERISDPTQLEESAKRKGITLSTIASYLDAFKYGAPRHGGCGIGLERFVMFYLGLNNIRKTSMFPRDPTRLSP
jgi:aspartyl-tRNA synthetase